MSKIAFKINGKQYEVGGECGPDVYLNEYIRRVAGLSGTKAMCHEGGCGSCIVTVRAPRPPDNVLKTFSVNSCLVSVLSCHGWEVTTVEGIGSRIEGYHPIQSRLAMFNGTQCGYCSPGWVMSMYSLYQSENKTVTSKEIENSFASNMCRCTGYRPILDAFKTFANDADPRLINRLVDLEEVNMIKSCGLKCSSECSHRDKCFIKNNINNSDVVNNINEESDEYVYVNVEKMFMVKANSHKWYRTYTLADAFKAISQGNYILIAGNTGKGVHHITEYPPIVIDIFNVAELKGYTIDVNLILGAAMTLSEVMELFLKLSYQREEFNYLKQFYDHLDLVAHIPVRNVGTVGGNIFLKHFDNGFPSDIFLLFETVGAMITIAVGEDREIQMKLAEFLKIDMKGKIIKNFLLPPLSQRCFVKTYKIIPRSQNAHAVVNAGFMFTFKENSNIIENASIVYGGIGPKFIHAIKTEQNVVGIDPYTDNTLQKALKTLYDEVNPVEMPPEPAAVYRKMLAITLYYKAILSLCPDNRMNSIYKSGADVYKRSTSHGTQSFETDRRVWPLNQPVSKLEAWAQCSGEATFANDLPVQSNEVFAAFVTADIVAGSVIRDFDTSKAFEIPGVIAFYTAKDIPGANSFTPTNSIFVVEEEEILCSKQVKFFGQPAAILVANSEQIANKAAKLVKIIYSSISKNRPLLTVDQVLKSPEKSKRVKEDKPQEPSEKGDDVRSVVLGKFKVEDQYHFYMEPQTCVTKPTEDGMDVYSGTQWLDLVNTAVAKCLNVSLNRVNVIVRRVGGGYGGKITRSSLIACSAALVTHLLGKTCRMVLPLTINMKSIGKRIPTQCNFEIGVNAEGEIQYLKNTFYQDAGCSFNDCMTFLTALHSHNCYDSKRWYVQGNSVLTDKPSNTSCRAPHSAEGVAMTEYMMEKIAFTLGKDPIQVKLLNMAKENNPVPEMIEQLRKDAKFDERKRQINEFNGNNRWRKRAINLIPLTVGIMYSSNFNAIVSIYHSDGSVVVTHAGIEMGQGINTKVAQVCAYTLGITIDKINVKPSSSFTSPNAMVTGGSIGSESVVFATAQACEILNKRLQAIKEKMEKPSWVELIEKAHKEGVNLQASYMLSTNIDEIKPYSVYAVGILEVEVDILTGNHDVRRVDILEDTGRSLSPEIDIGQIEGAFIMGLGYWSAERLVYEEGTGKLLTDRTWSYKIPGIKDIPADMRIYFRRGSRNPNGVLKSKATGEPAFCLGTMFMHAVREAVRSARKDAGYEDLWFDIDQPCTIENIFMAVEHKLEHFKLK